MGEETPREYDTWVHPKTETKYLIKKVDIDKGILNGQNVDLLQIAKPGTDVLCPNIFDLLETGDIELHYRPEIQYLPPGQQRKEDRLRDIAEKLATRQGTLPAVERLLQDAPIYFDKNQLWWIWNTTSSRWELSDETDILVIVRTALNLGGDLTVKRKNELLEALKQASRANPPEEMPLHWLQFKDTIYSLKTGETRPANPKYFSTNVIPWEIGKSNETPTIDKLFRDWVGEQHVRTLHEIAAYLCYRDYPIHLIFVLTGSGRNGKSKCLGLFSHFLGQENIQSTDLDRLHDNRFETFNLYKKLVAQMGETDVSTLRSTSLIKRMTGQDLIPYEAKGKGGFSDINYAKLVIATNSLPSSEDTSEGWYRRFLIVDFPNEFPEGRDILTDIPDKEYRNFAKKIIETLPELLSNGTFTNQGSIDLRRRRYIEASNPLQTFIERHCETHDPELHVRYGDLYLRYVQWLKKQKKRHVKHREFKRALEDAGLEDRRTTITLSPGQYERDRFVFGIAWKLPSTQVTQDTQQIPLTSIGGELSENIVDNLRNVDKTPESPEFENNSGDVE